MTDRRSVADRAAHAAGELIGLLDVEQRRIACWSFGETLERETWFYTPTDHGGLPLASMTAAQQQATWKLIATSTSDAGYDTVAAVVGHDNILDRIEHFSVGWDRQRGRDPGLYYLRIFGTPGNDDPWSWRFGGHHVSIHMTYVGGELVSTTPFFLGVDPASSPLLGGHLLRPLGAVEDLGRELVRSLDDGQRSRAVINAVAPADLMGANRPRFGQEDGDLALPLIDVWRGRFEGDLGDLVTKIQSDAEGRDGITAQVLESLVLTKKPRGLGAREMDASQQEILRALLDCYVGRIAEEVADLEMAKYQSDEDLAGLHFCWAGSLEPGEGHYYRVQGSTLLCEYDNTQREANHIHTVWRDLTGDFGADPLALHYRRDH